VPFGVFLRFALWICLSGTFGQALGASVESIRVWSGPESTRVVLDLSAPAAHRVFTLDGPSRLVIDLPHTALSAPLEFAEPKGFVRNIRTGVRPSGALRVVIDLSEGVRPQSFLLGPTAPYGHRLVVDLYPGNDATGSGAVAARVAAPVATAAAVRAPERGRDLVIAVDAGHGGKDPGATGSGGIREKDVVLSIARRLAAEIDREAGMQAVLIRDGDYYVSHRERMEVAHKARADLFVSVHADAYRSASAAGATVYALSTQRASDEVARRVAERENASDLIGGVSLSDKDDVLARVLLDLSTNAAISASLAVGSEVIDQMRTVTRLRKTQVQQAPFLVLTSPDIPSILIETAYISNPSEEAALNDANYQAALARAVFAGIVAYFRDNAPPGSYIASNPPNVPVLPLRHVISRGETLSGIASRYRISLSTLRRSNSIDGDVIRVGQVLTIPPG
jgi:N-acetylmuramoyl-L-alanine amidase